MPKADQSFRPENEQACAQMQFKNFGGHDLDTKVDFPNPKKAMPTGAEPANSASKAKMDQLHPPFAPQSSSYNLDWVKSIREQFTQNGIEPKIVINVMTSNNNFGNSPAATSTASTEAGAQTVPSALDENGCCASCHQRLPQSHFAGANSPFGMHDSMVGGTYQLGGKPDLNPGALDTFQGHTDELN